MGKKRKIVIVGSAYPLRGGLAAYNERIARAYQEIGDEVEIETFSLQYPDFLFPGKTQYSSDPPPDDLKINVDLNSINPLSWIKIGRKIGRKKPDLVIMKFWIPFIGPCLGTVARIIRKKSQAKIISIIDNIIPHEKRSGDRLLANYFVKNVDGFIAMSKSVLGELNGFDENKPKLFNPHPLYDGFGKISDKYLAYKKLNLDSDYSYILFFGFIRDYKGLDLLFEAMASKELSNRKIKLLVAGEFYTDSKPYYDLIEKLKINDKVIMANDFIPDSLVADYFNACDIVVQPYKTATQSGVTQIAYHFNKPMIVTDVGGLAEIVPDGKVGYIVNTNGDDIAKAIDRFYNEKDIIPFEDNIKEEKQKYSWNKMLSTIDELMKEIDDNSK